ncbi:MAG: lipocalin family protein [Maritimibacter harenae]
MDDPLMDGQELEAIPLETTRLQLGPVPGAVREGWGVHGVISLASGDLHVAAALVRLTRRGVDGSMILTDVLSATTDERFRQVLFTPGLVSLEAQTAEEDIDARLPGWVPGLKRMALKRHARDVDGLPARAQGVAIDQTGVRLAAAPFAVSGAGVLFAHDHGRHAMRITLPMGAGRALEGELALPEGALSTTMQGGTAQTAPALTLTGKVIGRAVEGQLWFDRVWGGRDAAPGPIGGERFAVTLGPTWHLLLTRAEGEKEGQAVLFEAGEPVDLPSGFRAEAAESWTSPATGRRYPVGWTLSVPDLELTARLTTQTPDQEIALPGTWPVWHGVTVLEGDLSGHPMAGHARVTQRGTPGRARR